MIAKLRRRHRFLLIGLAPIALGVLVSALAARAPTPRVAALPVVAAVAEGGAVLWEREDLFPSWPARVTGRAGRVIELKALRPLIRPDVLVYWTPTAKAGLATLPEDAHLVGRIDGTTVQRFPLPAHGRPVPDGALVLYSLGHQEVVTSALLPPFGAECVR